MEKNNVVFRVKLAGIPAEIRCRQEESSAFLCDYLTDEEPAFTCEITDDLLNRIHQEMIAEDRKNGEVREYSPRLLENNAIHAALAQKLVNYDVLLMHGSAVCVDGQAYLFTAASGTGKSTHARLWREVFGERAFMINDDKPLLRIEGDQVMVYGTPWNGKHHLGRNVCAPLQAIAYLNRADENRTERMSSAEAYPVLVRQAYSSTVPAVMRRILDMEKYMVQTVPFYRLWCNMEQEAVCAAWHAMSGTDTKSGSSL